MGGPRTSIVIAGMKHCGKTTHGRALAAHWQCPFYDTDDLVSEAYAQRTGRRLTVREICAELEEGAFRRAEVETVERLYHGLTGAPGRTVTALGGGLVMNAGIYPLIERLGVFVYLHVDPEFLFRRTMDTGLPAFLRADKPHAHFLEICSEREPYYTCFSELTIRLDDAPIAVTTSRIITKVEGFINAGQ